MPKKWDLRLEVGRNLQNFTDLEKAVGWIFKDGFAEEGTRTPTAFRPPAPKAGASANSATSASPDSITEDRVARASACGGSSLRGLKPAG